MIRKVKNWLGTLQGFGGCHRCGDTWNRVKGHSTEYAVGRGCFPLCEPCWAALTPEQRLPYYEMLMSKWEPLSVFRYWDSIEKAVLAGK